MPQPAGFAVEIEGLRDLRRDLRKINPQVNRELGKALKQGAEVVAVDARRRAPKSGLQKPARKHLAGSIKAGARGGAAIVRSPLPYANIVHWGGRRPSNTRDRGAGWIQVKGRPFISQAADAHAEDALKRIADGVDDVLRRNGFR